MPASPPRALSTTTDFGRELKHWLRASPARPAVRGVARRLGVSASTVYAYLSGATLPPTGVLDDLLIALEVPPAERQRLSTARDQLADRRHQTRPEPSFQPTPRENPAPPKDFVGRNQEVRRVVEALRDPTGGVVAITGTAGVGKTALALTAIGRVADAFPDGVIWVDLGGFSAGPPVPSEIALGEVLHRLGVPDDAGDLETLHRRFVSVVTARRLLIVLDNALDEEHVRPLVPGSGPSRVVVTSRTDVAGLRVNPGAVLVPLGPLPLQDSAKLLDFGQRAAADDLQRVAQRCGGLPLALRLAAARGAADGLEIADLAALLEDESALDTLDLGDSATAPRLVFAASESRLTTAERLAFQFLGVCPVTCFSTSEIAALWGVDEAAARRRLRWLRRNGLVNDSGHRGDNWQMHDLLHEFAAERAGRGLAAEDRLTALTRFVERFLEVEGESLQWQRLSACFDAANRLDAHAAMRSLAIAAGSRRNQFGRRPAMRSMFARALDAARETGALADVARFEALTAGILAMTGQHEEAIAGMHRATEVADQLDEPNLQAGVRNDLGNIYLELGRHDAAMRSYAAGLDPARRSGVVEGEATLLQNTGWALIMLGRAEDAESLCAEGYSLFESAGSETGMARAALGLGAIRQLQGRHLEALEWLERSTELAQRSEAAVIEGYAAAYRARVLQESGDRVGADRWNQNALRIAEATGERPLHRQVFEQLATAATADGDLARARQLWRRAYDLLPTADHPDAERLLSAAGSNGDRPSDSSGDGSADGSADGDPRRR